MTKSIKALSFLLIMSGSFMSEAMEDNSPEAMARKLGLTTQEYLDFLKMKQHYLVIQILSKQKMILIQLSQMPKPLASPKESI
jgi:hypothetical protein